MSFYDIFSKLCKEHHVTQSEVMRAIGLTQPVASMWKQRGSMPRVETLQKLSVYFDVPIGVLMGLEDMGGGYYAREIQDDDPRLQQLVENIQRYHCQGEKKLLTVFRQLNSEGQQKAVERVEELTEIPKYQKEKPPQD